MILDYAKKQTALFLAGSQNNYPTYFMIGSGSGTALASQTTLATAIDRQLLTSATLPTEYKITYTGDWTSMEASGITLKEFGLCLSGATTTGSLWSRTTTNSLVFDGSNELRIEETWEIY
jgi:hypothetical protein